MSTVMAGYRLQYPDLLTSLILFFSMNNRTNTAQSWRTVGDFCNEYSSLRQISMVQPEVVTRICSRIVEFGWMTACRSGTMAGHDDQYVTVVQDEKALANPAIARSLDCAIYGFPAVYYHYEQSVLPIEHYDKAGDQQIGTGFVIGPSMLVTAWHCLEGASKIAVKEVEPAELEQANFYRHNNLKLDIVAIHFSNPIFSLKPFLIPAGGQVLDEVMALGYPDVPGFHIKLAAERASIASRLTAATGIIASEATEMGSNDSSFLITARVKGGFSGGPLLDTLGQVVGMITQEPGSFEAPEGYHQYSDAGYGIAVTGAAIDLVRCKAQSGEGKASYRAKFLDFV